MSAVTVTNKKKARKRKVEKKNANSLFLRIVTYFAILLGVMLIVTIGLQDFYEHHYVLRIIYWTLTISAIIGLIGVLLLWAVDWASSIIVKVLFSLLAAPVFFVFLFSFKETYDLVQDKKVFDSKQCPTVNGIPRNATFGSYEDDGKRYLEDFKLKGVSYNTLELVIDRSFFVNELEGETVTVTYLPRTKYVVSIHADDWE